MAETLEEYAQLEPLWDKANQSPDEISLEEKHQLLEWPPLDVMQANAQKYLGHSVESLLHKAVTDPDSLTYSECRLIKDDFHIFSIMDQIKYSSNRRKWNGQRPDLQAKREQAHAAVLSPEELKALQNLKKVFFTIEMAHHEANEAERRLQPPRHVPQQWIQNVIDRDDKSWGYLFYHHKGQEGWDEFPWQFNDLLTEPYFETGMDQIEKFKVAQFVEFEAKDRGELDSLREDFRTRRDQGHLKNGVLSNVFFLVTDEARLSYSKRRRYTFAWAIDPDWSGSTADEDGYDGRVKISGAQIYFRFYEFMSTKRFTLKEIWRDFHKVNETQTYLPEPLVAWQFTELDHPVWPDC